MEALQGAISPLGWRSVCAAAGQARRGVVRSRRRSAWACAAIYVQRWLISSRIARALEFGERVELLDGEPAGGQLVHEMIRVQGVDRAPANGIELAAEPLEDPSLSTSGETLTIEESMTLRARMENAGYGDEHEWSWGSG